MFENIYFFGFHMN